MYIAVVIMKKMFENSTKASVSSKTKMKVFQTEKEARNWADNFKLGFETDKDNKWLFREVECIVRPLEIGEEFTSKEVYFKFTR